MTLTVYPQIEQRSDEWYDQRRGMVTASAVGQLVTPSTLKPANNPATRSITRLLVSERITGWTEPTFVSADMWRGIEDEPRAVETYAEHYGVEVESCGFMVRDDHGWDIGFSPDGLVGDDGLIEIKSHAPKEHLAIILADVVPAKYMAQVQCGLLVSGRLWADLISYCGGMPMWVRRVTPDERWMAAICDAVEAFELTAAEMVTTYRNATKGLAVTERIPNLDDIRI